MAILDQACVCVHFVTVISQIISQGVMSGLSSASDALVISAHVFLTAESEAALGACSLFFRSRIDCSEIQILYHTLRQYPPSFIRAPRKAVLPRPSMAPPPPAPKAVLPRPPMASKAKWGRKVVDNIGQSLTANAGMRAPLFDASAHGTSMDWNYGEGKAFPWGRRTKIFLAFSN